MYLSNACEMGEYVGTSYHDIFARALCIYVPYASEDVYIDFVISWLGVGFLRNLRSDVNSPQTQGRHLRGSQDLNVEIRS